MTTQTTKTTHTDPSQDAEKSSPDVLPATLPDPVEILRRGLIAMHKLGSTIYREAAFASMRRLNAMGGRRSAVEKRVLSALVDIRRHQELIAENVAVLGGSIEGESHE